MHDRKTQSVSFRLPTKTISEIKKEANQKETSTNVLVNQVLQRFVSFDRYELKLCLLPIPKPLIMEIVSNFREKEIKSFAEMAFKFVGGAALLIHKRQDLGAFLLVLKEYAKVAGIVSDHIIKEGKDIIVIQHDMGLKCSELVKEFLDSAFEKLAGLRADYELTESFVVAKIELPQNVRSSLIV